MKIYHSTKVINAHQGAVIVIGKFDGLHLAHRMLIERARAIAHKHSLPLGVLTFAPHPTLFFQRKDPEHGFLITPDPLRLHLFKAYGFDFAVIQQFDDDFADMRAHQFTERLLQQDLEARHIVVGENFLFGRDREGGVADLKLSKSFTIHTLPMQSDDNYADVISATKIRQHIRNGEVALANEKLGHAFTIIGKVLTNTRLGHELGFPTANIYPMKSQILPKFGVYAGRVRLRNGEIFDTAINWGMRPTVKQNAQKPMFEAHILDFDQDIYDQEIHLCLIDYLREEQSFAGLEPLQVQIQRDCNKTRKVLINQPLDHPTSLPISAELPRDLIPQYELTQIEAATFRRMVKHFQDNPDVQNIDLMLLADFCRNCLSRWFQEEAETRGYSLRKEAAHERIYGMAYDTWKAHHQTDADPAILAELEARKKRKKSS